jgi:hypothetical protein
MSATVTPSDNMSATLGTNPGVERVYDNVLATLPATTQPLIQLALWNAVEEFCIRSLYFREKVYWQMAPGVFQVDFNPFSSTQLVTWVLSQYGLTNFRVVPPAILEDLQVPPLAARTGWAWVVLKPTSFQAVQQQNAFPELWNTWFETMLDGTMFRLTGQPAKPWSSAQLAQYHGQRFRMGLNRARDIAERLHSDQQSPRRTYPYYAHGRRKQ